MHAKLLQLCLTLCDPMEYSLPGSSVHGSLQARMLEWAVAPSSRGSSWQGSNPCLFRDSNRMSDRVLCLFQAGSLTLDVDSLQKKFPKTVEFGWHEKREMNPSPWRKSTKPGRRNCEERRWAFCLSVCCCISLKPCLSRLAFRRVLPPLWTPHRDSCCSGRRCS